MKLSFNPLGTVARQLLIDHTGIDFSQCDFRQEEQWLCCTATDKSGHVAGVLVCEFKTWFDVHFSCVILDQRCMSRKLLRAIFTALFSRATRVTAHVEPDNLRAERQMRRLGFSYEGFLRRGLDGRRDALVFGMLAEECPWLWHVRPRMAAPTGLMPARAEMH